MSSGTGPSSGQPPTLAEITISLGRDGQRLPVSLSLTGGPAQPSAGSRASGRSALELLLRAAPHMADGASGGAPPLPPPGLPAGLTAHIMAIARGPPAEAGVVSTTGAPASASAAPAPTSDPTLDRIQRLSTAVAGSIFSDLISGALRPGDVGPPPASEEAISKLARNVSCEAGQQCSVCLCELAAASEGATQMPCKHAFHDACITKWLRSHNTCPVCRTTIEADETPRPPSSLVSLLQGWRQRADGDGAARATSEPSPAHASTSTDAPSHAPPETLQGAARMAHAAVAAHHAAQAAAGRGEAPPTDAEIERMSVAELKRRLTAAGVDFAGIVDKRELVELLRRHSHTPQPPRLHVQLHMELVPLPPSLSGRAALEAAARHHASARTMVLAGRAASSADTPAAAALDAPEADSRWTRAGPAGLPNLSSPFPAGFLALSHHAAESAPDPADPPTTSNAATQPDATPPTPTAASPRRSRRRGREHVPGELKEPNPVRRRRT